MANRSHRRQKRKGLAILNCFLLVFCVLFVGVLIYHYKSNSINHTVREFTQVMTKQSKKSSHKGESKKVTNSNKKGSSPKQVWQKASDPLKVPILMYHAVHVMGQEEKANENLIVSPDTFESQIKALSQNGYYFLTPEEAFRILSKNEKPSHKYVWLTFDDSMIDFYNVAYPILKKYKAKATNNVITGLTQSGSKGNLTITQMLEMKKDGMSFQDHTVNHPDLSLQSDTVQKNELKDSKVYLDEQLHQNTIAVAYPSGRYNDSTLNIAQSLNYKLGVTTHEGLASVSDGLLSLKRIRILPTTSAQQLLETIQ
ncbi:hypothetical protein HMPREF9318_00296 [Streptococcus urinalis FB127-CNA-2]|uniref:Polysaccharide deacetylase n=1 Tax=Streptococcus urinalis 2285-97 TaxID=764291 RepID=G5KFN6_9STRE|nr:polysaccharide deacetylase family protein [Streptococcus urinalis]EHJ57247.1 polysaccharide deacetylase [Streptococcus urinalis 2285-97]EKS22098.1 hypothetical protein HMPREF9318_00296 [Streptococcus urinalis FB127-CNA-2]VEF31910.1 polysaccharide deacetylase [Streptococcus urinalis]